MHYTKEINNDIQDHEHLIHSITNHIQKYSYNTYHYQIERFVSDHEQIRKAFAEKNRERLYEISTRRLQNYQQENPFFHAMDFNLPDGTVFLRVQNPEIFGDNILHSRQLLSSVHKYQEQKAGFDIGKHGAIYWVAEPVFYDGRYIGAVEFGIEAKQLMEALKINLQGHVSSILRGQSWHKAVLINEGFQDRGDYVLMTQGMTIFDQLPKSLDLSSNEDQFVHIKKKEYILHNCSDLLSYNGVSIGRIILLKDISRKVSGKKDFIFQAVSIGLSLILFSFIVVHYSFYVLTGRLERYANETREAKDELQKAHDKLENRVAERTVELQDVNDLLQEEIQERLRYQGKLEKQQKRLRAVSSQMLAIEEEQRRHIAIDLHDRIGQSLALCQIVLDSIEEMKTIEDVRGEVSRVSEIIQQTIQDTRSLTFELCPPVLHELGLGAALEWLSETLEESYDLLVTVENEGLASYVDSSILTLAFRATRELLMNVVKHAGTNRAKVKVWVTDNKQMHIQVSDSGTGFNSNEVGLESDRLDCFGLFSIQERAINIGGSMSIDSAKGRGTTVALILPLDTEKDNFPKKE